MSFVPILWSFVHQLGQLSVSHQYFIIIMLRTEIIVYRNAIAKSFNFINIDSINSQLVIFIYNSFLRYIPAKRLSFTIIVAKAVFEQNCLWCEET